MLNPIVNPAFNVSKLSRVVIFLILLSGSISLTGCIPPQTGAPRGLKPTYPYPQQQIGKAGTYYSGYSQSFQPYKQQLSQGMIEEVELALAAEEEEILTETKEEAELVDKLRLVGLMERASIALQTGDAVKTRRYCTLAQNLIEERESESYMSQGFGELEKLMTKLF